jgi:hypothetical protein
MGAQAAAPTSLLVLLAGNSTLLRSCPAFNPLSDQCNSLQINPDDVVYQFGADSLRLYEMFMGPLRDTKVRETIVRPSLYATAR